MLDRQGLACIAKLVEGVAQSKALLTVGSWSFQIAVSHDALAPTVVPPEDTDDPNEHQATFEIAKHPMQLAFDNAFKLNDGQATGSSTTVATTTPWTSLDATTSIQDAAVTSATHGALDPDALLAKLLASSYVSVDALKDKVEASSVNVEALQTMSPQSSPGPRKPQPLPIPATFVPPAPAAPPPAVRRCPRVIPPPPTEHPDSRREAEADGNELSKTPTPPRPLPELLRAPTFAPPPRPAASAPSMHQTSVSSVDVGPWSSLAATDASAQAQAVVVGTEGSGAAEAEESEGVAAPTALAEPAAQYGRQRGHSAGVDVSAASAAASPHPAVSAASTASAALATSTVSTTPQWSTLIEHDTTSTSSKSELYEGIPQECLDDPYMELRRWDSGQKLWPYCTLCYCWSDKAHLAGARHIKRLQSAEYYDLKRAPSSCAPTAPSEAQPVRSQPAAVPLASWTTPAVVERRAPRRPTSGEVLAWHVPYVSFQWEKLEET